MIERDPFYFRLFSIIFWVVASWGFVTQELLPFLTPLTSVVFLLCDVIVFILGIVTLRARRDKWALFAYLIIGIISTVLLNHESIVTFVNGTREFIGMLFVVPVIRYLLTCDKREHFKAQFDKQLYVYLWVQAVCITWQFIRYGANDHGGGSMGNGYSGIASLTIYMISFYFVSRNWDKDHYIQSLKDNKIYLFLLYPTLLNETKSSFVLLLFYFLLLYKFEMRKIGSILAMVPIVIIGLIGLGYAYLTATNQDVDTLTSGAYYQDYLVGDDPEFLIDLAHAVQDEDVETDNLWVVDLPRFTKVFLISELLEDARGGMFWGAGVGQFKGGENLNLTRFAKQNNWAMQGTRPCLFYIMIQLGFIGLIWFFVNLISILSFKKRPVPLSLENKVFLILATILIMFYNDAFRTLIFCNVFMLIALLCLYEKPQKKLEEHGK